MFRVYAHEYIALGENIHDLRVLFYGKDTLGLKKKNNPFSISSGACWNMEKILN